ncbi:MAG: DUF4340 domain-containing protein [Deltaproteobacteria bacterium]|nr:DUF4340 domain-containing protein [Deltaproteobacteria bacterium]
MKSAKEYIILIIVILGLGGYLFFHNTDHTRYKLPVPENIKSADITKIVINKKGSNIELKKKDDNWVIMPKAYPADKTKLKSITESLADLTITAMVSEGENDTPYELDPDHQIRVTAFAGDKKVRDVTLGKIAPTYRHTFVRMDGDKKIYHAKGNLKNTFNKKTDDLRDKGVLSFETADIGKIEIHKGNEALKLALATPPVDVNAKDKKSEKKISAADKQPSWLDESGKKIEKKKVDNFIKKLSDLKCASFVTDKTKKDFSGPIFTAGLSGTKDYSLSIYAKQDEKADKYPAVSSGSDFPFFLSKYTAEDIMKKLLPEKKEKAGNKSGK